MNLLQTIINYYHGESRHGFWAVVIGGLLFVGSIMLWKWASPLSIFKGFTVPMFLFGLLMGIGGVTDNLYTNKTAPEKIALYQKDSSAFLKQEKVKTEKTHKRWHGIRIFWGLLGLSGLVLSLLISKPFWIGAGLGTVALAIFLSIFEFYSMRFNERYYRAIQSASSQDVNTHMQEIHDDIHRQVKTQLTLANPRPSEKGIRKLGIDTLSADTITDNSLMAVNAPTTFIIKDSVRFITLNDLKLRELINEVAQVSLKGNKKKSKVLDYYNSDLIQADGVNAKYCWFSKKYIKQ